jgi:hypothetical protein
MRESFLLILARSLQFYGSGVEGELHDPRDELSFPVRLFSRSCIGTEADKRHSVRASSTHPSLSVGRGGVPTPLWRSRKDPWSNHIIINYVWLQRRYDIQSRS